MNDPRHEDILRDIPKLHERIMQCERSKLDYERNIIVEEGSISQLQMLILEDELRLQNGKRTRYDKSSMLANVDKHRINISLFKSKIEEENSYIEKFQYMIKVLEDDMNRKPTEIIF